MNIWTILILLGVIEIKHLICDWFLQSPFIWIWGGKGKARFVDYFLPLLTHAGLHALFTLVIFWIYSGEYLVGLLAGELDLITHFVIDRIKSSPYIFGRFKNDDKWFWILLGADQAAHHINYLIIVGLFYK